MARFRIIITTCIIAFAIPLMATEDIPDDEAHFGARLQLEFNTSSRESQLVQWGPGGSAGIAYYAPFGRFTYFNARLMALYDTFRYDGPAGTKYNPQYFDGHIDMIGLRLPLDFGFKFYENRNLRLSIYTGPHFYFNFKFTARYDNIHKTYVEHVETEYTTSGMEIGWGIGTAVDFKRHWHLQFEYTHGLSDIGSTYQIRPGEASNFRRCELALGLGYNF